MIRAAAIAVPRLLPMTIVGMALLLAVQTAALVQDIFPGSARSGAALAAELPAPSTAPSAAPAGPAARPAPSPPSALASSSPAAPEITEAERALLTDLRRRRAELDAREASLAARESVLAAAEKRLTARLDELGTLQKRLEAMEAARRAHDDENWHGLVKLYEAMKPRDAAAIFNDLDLPVLLGVVDRMKETKAAPILAAMQTDRAREVTAELRRLRAAATTPPPAPITAPTPAPMPAPAPASTPQKESR